MSGFLRWSLLLTAACLTLMLGCHTLKLAGLTGDKSDKSDKDSLPARPSKDSFRLGQYVFFSDLEMKREVPLFKEMSELRDQIHKELQLPNTGNLINVYLFGDKIRYDDFIRTRYPDLPERRAFFIAQPHNRGGPEELLVFTYWSDRLRQDLRHELTHAQLHSILKDVPLWLDEGLAEYFELPSEWKGLNRAHVRALCQTEVRPKPDSSGTIEPGTADVSRGIPRSLGLGAPHAARQRRGEGGAARLSAAVTDQLQPGSAVSPLGGGAGLS